MGLSSYWAIQNYRKLRIIAKNLNGGFICQLVGICCTGCLTKSNAVCKCCWTALAVSPAILPGDFRYNSRSMPAHQERRKGPINTAMQSFRGRSRGSGSRRSGTGSVSSDSPGCGSRIGMRLSKDASSVLILLNVRPRIRSFNLSLLIL